MPKRKGSATNKEQAQSRKRAQKSKGSGRNSGPDSSPERMQRLLAPEEEKITVLLVGMTRSGKSSVGNRILGEDFFRCGVETFHCVKGTRVLDTGDELAIIDTPGLFHNRLTPREMKRELVRCVSLCAPGPHVFLMVINPDQCRPPEEHIVRIIQTLSGGGAASHTMVLFTHGNIENIRREQVLLNIIQDCGAGYYVLNNNVNGLITRFQEIKNSKGYYSNSMFQLAERAINAEMRGTNPDQRAEDERRQGETDNTYIRVVDAVADLDEEEATALIAEVGPLLARAEIGRRQGCITQ